ncbi:SOS response-associated peptidase [Gimesia benthica]|uniref:Abasic site processing protein n=1 Tax=Gimesia benthica TaxID=2608982 RepID=A0A6I6ABM9_9PLAN|nr:SOS response-associated peptidase [Gimesia benthica]QGQ23396.1 SOS response-associated peptidase [Gimesia benthica]
MCARFFLFSPDEEIKRLFQMVSFPRVSPRYNIAPSQPVLAITNAGAELEVRHFQWGFIPAWSKDPQPGQAMINARSETAASKPSFKNAFRYRRCLIPANGFYEWKSAGNRSKQAMCVRLGEEPLFAMAGLWEQWSSLDGSELETCSVLTTAANSLLEGIHPRMPVILRPEQYRKWLSADTTPIPQLETLLQTYPADEMQAYPVSSFVNRVANDSPECIEPIREQKTLF